MGRLKTLQARLQSAPDRKLRTANVSERRITGSKLISRRFKLWKQDPRCGRCGRITDYPYGFELDHKIPLSHGGLDTEENCQILCVHMTPQGKAGCHMDKTREDARL